MTRSLLSLPFEVRQCIYHHYYDWEYKWDIYVIELEDNATASPLLRGLWHEWRFLLSICRLIRAEMLYHLMRRYSDAVCIVPSFTHNLNHALRHPLRRVNIQIIHERRTNGFPTATFIDVQEFVKAAAGHATLEQIDLVIDCEVLYELTSSERLSGCLEHKLKLRNSLVQKRIADDLHVYCDQQAARFVDFRIHFSKHAMARTRCDVLDLRPHLTSNRNVSIDKCDDHEVGLCENLLCRLLHAMEEYCDQVDCHIYDKEGMAYLEKLSDSHSFVWQGWDAMDPIMVEAPSVQDQASEVDETSMHGWPWLTIKYRWPQLAWEFVDGTWFKWDLDSSRLTAERRSDGFPIQSSDPA